jgi:hypothetical protein
MNPRRMRDMLGTAGAAALASAAQIISETYPESGDLSLTWSNWTGHEWNFTFARHAPPGRLVIHLPHDGGPVVIDELGPSDRAGAGPLGDPDAEA